MQNDGRMQLFKPIPTRQSDWSALAHELRFPVNLITTSQVAEVSASLLLALRYENKTYPSTMLLQDWGPLEAGAALQKWKKKLPKAFGATSINAGKQPVSLQGQVEEDPSKIPLPPTLRSGDRTRRGKTGADRGAFGTTEASTYFQDSHIVMPSSASRTPRMNAANESPQGSRVGKRAPGGGAGRRLTVKRGRRLVRNRLRRRRSPSGAGKSDGGNRCAERR
ncbi:hypothetical protein PI126_g4475 [Phytophthora idaei]|nr:hypothetical protein PI126_g4475 [Phytophthora idaei]